MKLSFLGAAQTVTGSRMLLDSNSQCYLIDCGLYQGAKEKRQLNWESNIPWQKLSGIIITHAHIDHSGYIPRLYRLGYRGPVYATPATTDLCRIMLLDAAYLQEEDAKYANDSQYSSHRPALALYTKEDAENCMSLFQSMPRDQWHQLSSDFSFRFQRSGHILGSSFVEFSYPGEGGKKVISFSGDLGNGRQQTIRPPVYLQESDYLVLESTYGNRMQPRHDPGEELALYLNTILKRGGVAIIPTFTVGRAQEVLYYLQKLEANKKIPSTAVYVDSPMARAANRIFFGHPDEHKPELNGDHLETPICPSRYFEIQTSEESKSLVEREGPAIILSAAGMLTGGRVLHHLKKRLPDRRNGVIFVGYQVEETKGRVLENGVESLRIHHQEVPVRASIFSLQGLSAHADFMDTLDWLKHFKRLPRLIFLNHGELPAARYLKDLIEAEFPTVKVTIPSTNEIFRID